MKKGAFCLERKNRIQASESNQGRKFKLQNQGREFTLRGPLMASHLKKLPSCDGVWIYFRDTNPSIGLYRVHLSTMLQFFYIAKIMVYWLNIQCLCMRPIRMLKRKVNKILINASKICKCGQIWAKVGQFRPPPLHYLRFKDQKKFANFQNKKS